VARIDREIRKLQRTLSAWQQQKRTARNESIIVIGTRAIRAKLRDLSRQRQRTVAA